MAGVDHAALHVVTNDEVLARDDFLRKATAVLDTGRGAVALHLRGPHTDAATLMALGEGLREAAVSSGASLVVNDRVDVALALRADGVHLGHRSLSPARVRALVGDRVMSIGVSCHSAAGVRAASEARADYAFFGAVHATASHPGRRGAGVDALALAASEIPGFPVVAIGGIVTTGLAEVAAAGVTGVAVIRGVWDAEDPAEAVRRYISALAATHGTARTGGTGPGIDRPAERA